MYKICSYWEEAAVWHRELSSVLCDNLKGRDADSEREAPEGGDICTNTADSHCCMAETNTTL